MDMWRDGDDFGGIWDRETLMSIYCTKKLFSIKKKTEPSLHMPQQ